MPPDTINTNQTANQQVLDQQKRELQNNYIIAVQNISVTSLESQKSLITSWLKFGKLVNDFFTFSLITLGVAATILTAKATLISSRGLFFTSLGLLTFVIVFSSFLRLYLDFKATTANRAIFNNFNDTISKIDIFRLDPENPENKVKMEESVNKTNSFIPQENWLIKYAQAVIATVFVSAFLLFVLSMIISVSIPKT